MTKRGDYCHAPLFSIGAVDKMAFHSQFYVDPLDLKRGAKQIDKKENGFACYGIWNPI
jgi:hypothetical protein